MFNSSNDFQTEIKKNFELPKLKSKGAILTSSSNMTKANFVLLK